MVNEESLEELREKDFDFPSPDIWPKINAKITLEWLMRDAGLSKKLRDVMQLKVKGYKDTKIAEILGVNRSIITTRKLRAIKMMKLVIRK